MGKTVRTTIVGGRPPGEGETIGATPRGLEVLLKKASLDKAFRKVLLADPEKAARKIQLDLSEAEEAMLRSIPRRALSQMISQVRVPGKQRLAFAGTTAAVMLAAPGATLTGCGERQGAQPAGERPDRPPGREEVVTGERPDRPPKKEEKAEEATTEEAPPESEEGKEPPVTRGISPDRPPKRSESAE